MKLPKYLYHETTHSETIEESGHLNSGTWFSAIPFSYAWQNQDQETVYRVNPKDLNMANLVRGEQGWQYFNEIPLKLLEVRYPNSKEWERL